MLQAKSTRPLEGFLEYDSVKSFKDSVRYASKNEVSLIEVNVEYNLIVLDKVILQNSEEKRPIETERACYPVGAYISFEQKGAGIEKIYIKIDKAQERLYTKPMRLSQQGYRTLLIRGLDGQGNEIIVQPLFINIIPQ
ncbi:MAG: hypothetical protein KF860_17460 [Cyclobacteriaceae bacterium]|nr:hypothetical protein [Cyclobacteriaceae bacterium]